MPARSSRRSSRAKKSSSRSRVTARPPRSSSRTQRSTPAPRTLSWGPARRWDRAESERRAELLLRPEDPLAHLGLSLALMGQGHLEEALKEAETAASLDPKRASAPFQQGLILQRLGRLREAE